MSLVVSRRRRAEEINVVPLIDVMVVLVFFLLLSGRFERTRALAIVPPTASAGSPSTDRPDARRRRRIATASSTSRASPSPPRRSARPSSRTRSKSPGTEVIIVADERSLTGAAIRALDAAAKAGLKPRLQTRQPR
jgi:biopolymer transport protein ExbD